MHVLSPSSIPRLRYQSSVLAILTLSPLSSPPAACHWTSSSILVFSLSLVHNASIQCAAPMPGNMMTLPVLGACVSALLYFYDFERPELPSLTIPLPSPHDVVVQFMSDGTIAALLDEYDSDGE